MCLEVCECSFWVSPEFLSVLWCMSCGLQDILKSFLLIIVVRSELCCYSGSLSRLCSSSLKKKRKKLWDFGGNGSCFLEDSGCEPCLWPAERLTSAQIQLGGSEDIVWFCFLGFFEVKFYWRSFLIHVHWLELKQTHSMCLCPVSSSGLCETEGGASIRVWTKFFPCPL